jgi:signal transduction histidine kinase
MTVVGPELNDLGSSSRLSDASSISMFAGAATTVAVLAAAVLSASAAGTGEPSGVQFVAWSALSLAGGVALVATLWLLRVGHPMSSIGLSLVSLAWVLPRLSSWASLPPRVQVVLLAATPLALAGSALLAAGWSRSKAPSRMAWVAVDLATAALVVHLVGYDPFFDPECQFACTGSPAVLANVIGVRATIAVVAVLTVGAAVAAVGVGLSSTGPGVVRAGAAVAATLVAIAEIARWRSWGTGRPPVTADRLEALGTAAAALLTAVALIHAHTVQRRVRRVVAQLAFPGLLGRSGDVVRHIHFAVSADGRWVDSAGQEVSGAECGHCAVLTSPEGPSVHLVLRRWEQPEHVLAAVTPAARLALENARLYADGLLRLVDLRASQRRIVEVADVERRRIERDLHDGAQQRLVAVRMHLASARTRSGGLVPETLEAAETHVSAALTALRELSHDSLGSGLVAEGLVVAVEELLATTSVQVGLCAEIDETHFSAAVAMTAYLAIAEGCRNLEAYSGTAYAQVTLLEDEDGLVLRVLDEGRGGAVVGRGLTEIADRVGALAGQFTVDSPLGEGTHLTVRLPCES